MEVLKREFDWKYYGGKHYESTFTKFYQAYILPEKFGVDKRRCHLSAQIRNGEITRDKAESELEEVLYAPDELVRDKEFVLKKLGFDEVEFDQIMSSEPVAHDHYGTDQIYIKPMIKVAKWMLKNFQLSRS